ncbi:hypothetical protein J6590_032683 [Homalodisca vitripennis]|nr:hypothetical protein J6590_032683 [Homalodisca vitripennis]
MWDCPIVYSNLLIYTRNHQRVQLAATNRMDWPSRRCHTTAAAARHGWRIVADKPLRCHN